MTWKDTNIFNNANLCTPKKVAKNNDCVASVYKGSRARDSFNQLAKKLITCLVALLTRGRKEGT